MRYFFILLLFPTWASAQIMPEQIIGFAKVEDEVFSLIDHAVLVRDGQGWADLYIIHESTGAPTEFIDNILEIKGALPTLSINGGSYIEIVVASEAAGNTIEKSWWLAPIWMNDGPFGPYQVIDMAYTVTPLGAEGFIYSCGIDFEVGGMRIVGKDELIAIEEIDVAGPLPHDLGRDDIFELCHT